MILLAIEAAGDSCSAALWDCSEVDDGLLAWRGLEPARGQAERLIGLVEAALGEAGLRYDALGALAVNRGPGSFTGLRSAVAAARGLALATGLGVVAVTSLEALACGVRPGLPGEVLAALDARRGEVYAQRFTSDLSPLPGPAGQPRVMPPRAAAAGIAGPVRLVGSGAGLIQAVLPEGVPATLETVRLDARLVARCAARRLAAGERPVAGFEVQPLYLRPADARPQAPLVVPARACAGGS